MLRNKTSTEGNPLRSALDSATGEEVLAARDVTRRAYKCPNCGKRVKLRSGSLRVYFAHANGVANSECDLYVSPRIEYSGRRYVRLVATESKSFLRFDHLAFGVGSLGPQLELFLPPTDQEQPWIGTLRFTAAGISRTFRYQHLLQGQRCKFPLAEGTWTVVPNGGVGESYLERIEIGPQSLAEGQNLFDASRDFGRQILPGESVFAGDSLWWLSRNEIRLPPNLNNLASCSQQTIANDWFIYRIELDPVLGMGWQRDALARWLQRPVRPQRARVWIEEPWAWGHSALGIPIFDITADEMAIRSDQRADIAVRSVETGEVMVSTEMATDLSWNNVKEGYWELVVNGIARELFLVSKVGPSPSNVIARIDGDPPLDFAGVQASFAQKSKGNSALCQIELSWGEDSVADLIRLDGKRISTGKESPVLFSLKPGTNLSIDKFGEATWAPLLPRVAALTSNAEPLRLRAAWLLSVSRSDRRGVRENIRVPPKWQKDPLIRQLMGAKWPQALAPQVRALQRLLELK